MGPWRCLLLLPLLAAALRAQQQQFMEYVERRLTLLEVGPVPASTPLAPLRGLQTLPPRQPAGLGAGLGEEERDGTGQSWRGVPLPQPAPKAQERDGHRSTVGQAGHGSGGVTGLGASRARERHGRIVGAGALRVQDGAQGCTDVWLWGLPQPRAGSGTAAVIML